jgi:hypothetical protein
VKNRIINKCHTQKKFKGKMGGKFFKEDIAIITLNYFINLAFLLIAVQRFFLIFFFFRKAAKLSFFVVKNENSLQEEKSL